MARILVVEDYPDLQLQYETALKAAGHTVTLAGDGTVALKLAKDSEPDLILLDMLLPTMGGLEFLKLYDLKTHPHTKVIVFSNMASPELFQEAKQLGAAGYLIKAKYTPKEMVAAVTAALPPAR